MTHQNVTQMKKWVIELKMGDEVLERVFDFTKTQVLRKAQRFCAKYLNETGVLLTVCLPTQVDIVSMEEQEEYLVFVKTTNGDQCAYCGSYIEDFEEQDGICTACWSEDYDKGNGKYR